MPKWTNVLDLPAPIVSAVTNDTYRKSGEFSVSGLIKPPQMLQLQQRHDAEITLDVKDQLNILLGKAMHAVLELAGKEHLTHLIEEELIHEVLGVKVSGRPDCVAMDEGVLTDYKTVSVWSFLLGEKPEWIAQTNTYAHILRQQGKPVKRLQIIALLKDWTSSKIHEADYPPCGILKTELPVWTDAECEAYIVSRVQAHVAARIQPDAKLPPCTAEERWEKPPQFVVMKDMNAARAAYASDSVTKKPLTEARALELAQEKGMVMVRRAGESVRCARFCSALPFCRQGKWLVAPQERAPATAAEV